MESVSVHAYVIVFIHGGSEHVFRLINVNSEGEQL